MSTRRTRRRIPLARLRHTSRDQAINLEVLCNADLLTHLERGAAVLGMVSGAYTARVLDSGADVGQPVLVMELLDGRPFDAHLCGLVLR